VLYRKTTDTVLVAGEGDDRVAELDAFAVDPTLAVLALYPVGARYHHAIEVAAEGAAPAGMALARDERTLYVYCRATNDVVEIALRDPEGGSLDENAVNPASARKARLALGDDPLGPGGATGRKLFYNATDPVTSGGLACAGCHPEGRDDGHVWHEASFVTEDGDVTTFVGSAANVPKEAHARGYPRRTPMLAGRVNADGPYGWHAESPNIVDREARGFGLHRWGAVPERDAGAAPLRAKALGDFLRRGLVAPAPPAELDDAAKRGRALFTSKVLRCAECHVPETGYTTRAAYALPPLPAGPDFDDEADARFKIPSLLHLSGRAPYFHDGSAATLESLVENNRDRMGETSHLKKEERADLVAFLRTL
jgi:mono/diheme cytochrome c family protein